MLIPGYSEVRITAAFDPNEAVVTAQRIAEHLVGEHRADLEREMATAGRNDIALHAPIGTDVYFANPRWWKPPC